MIQKTKVRYEVEYEDYKGQKWYRGKESGLYKYENAKKYAEFLQQRALMKDIKIIEVTEIYRTVDIFNGDDKYEK